MLPRHHRLRNSADFARTVRRGRRIRSGRLVGYLDHTPDGELAPKIGLVVSRQVGNAVARHRVARVLRHAAAEQVDRLPRGSLLVLRALPGAVARDRRLIADVADIVTRGTRER